MPIYEYKCTECGGTKEALQKFSDAPLTTCPHCGKETLEKTISANTGFVLMGHGWHRPGMRAGSSGKR
jgi:putative FmdB family regulatory protein